MSTRKRTGTWQDEVARGFSRLFSRTSSQEKEEEGAKDQAEEQDRSDRSLSRLFFRSSSQEKKDGSDRTEHGEEQERSHSPSRLFFRKITQESKGSSDHASSSKGNREEQDRSRGFSRLFSRTSSQEEEGDSSRGATEDHNRHEDNHSNLTSDNHEELISTEPEQVTLEPNFVPILHNISEPGEEKDEELTHNSKVLDSEKQSRENFFHFLGSLFHFSPKSPLGNSKPGADVKEPCKEPEEAQVKNNLDKEDISQESRLDDHSGIEEASEQSTTWHEQENPGVSGDETPKDEAPDTLILNGHAQDAPSITYGTYRGSRRIRKLLKRRPDVNSPILEKEETPETSSVGDATTESCLMLHQSVQMELVPGQNYQDEIPSSKININIESKHEPPYQNPKLYNDDNLTQKAEDLKLSSDPEIEVKDSLIGSNIVDVDIEKSSEIVEGQQPNIDKFVIEVPQLNFKESSESLLPNTRESIEELQHIVGESLNINFSCHSQNSKNLEPNNNERATDAEPKTVDILDSVTHVQPNTNEVSKQPEDLQPNYKESISFPEILQASIDYDSKSDTDLCPEVEGNVNILPNTEENIEHVNANTAISSFKTYETFSAMDGNLQSEAKDALMRTKELEESSKEKKNFPVDLGICVTVNTQSALQQSDPKVVLVSEENSQQAVEVNSHFEEKPLKDFCDSSHIATHNNTDKSSDKNYEDFASPTSDCLQASVERKSNIIDFQSNALLVSSNTVDVVASRMDKLIMEEQLQFQGEEDSKLPNREINCTSVGKILSESKDTPDLHLTPSETFGTSKDLQQENGLQNGKVFLQTEPQPNIKEMSNIFSGKQLESEDVPNVDLQLNDTFRNSEDLKQAEHIEHPQTNAESNLQNYEQLDKTEQQPNSIKVFFQSNDLSNSFLEKTLSESKGIPHLDLHLSATSMTSKDLKEIVNIEHLQANAKIPENNLQNNEDLPKTEQQPNIKMSSQLKDTYLVKTPLESKDISDLDLQSGMSRTSKDLKQIVNIEHLQTNGETIPDLYPQKDGKLLQSTSEVTFQLTESSSESSDGIVAEVEETSEVNLCLDPNSEISIPKISSDALVHKVYKSLSGEGLPESSHRKGLDNENNAHVDKPDGAKEEQNIKSAIFYDTLDNMTVPQSCVNDISSFRDHGAVTSRNISFDNGIECRSPSPPTMSDSSSYADCSDVQFDSPNDSGIVSLQAYTPDEHFLFKTLPSEILIKNTPETLEVDQKSEEASVQKLDISVNVPNVPVLQNKEPVINMHNVSEEEPKSLADGCAPNLASNVSSNILTPDKQINLKSDVCLAKVSLKTVNIEEVKISPYVLCSDIISVAKLESPTFTKEVICIPNVSPTPTDIENIFQVFHSVENDKDFVTNRQIPNDKGGYLAINNCEKHLENCYLETDGLPLLKKDKIVDSDNNDNSDSISQNRCIENQSLKITNKSPDVLKQNLKNNNMNVSTSDIINTTLQVHKSEKLANETLMSSESLKELGGSLSELNPDLLLHSSLLHDVTDTKEIISSGSTTEKMIPANKQHLESSDELFEQKANEIILSVLHSAIDELHHINIMSINNNTLTDIKHIKENLSENQRNLEDRPAKVLVECQGKPSDRIVIGDTDLIMSMAVGIVNEVLSSSKQLVVSSIIPDALSKDITTNKDTKQKPPRDFNDLSLDNQSDKAEDATNSNHLLSPPNYDNVVHLPSFEINSNVLHVETGAAQNGESLQLMEPKSLTEKGSLVTEEVCENGTDRTIENSVLTKTENEEPLNFSRDSVKADTDNLMNENYNNKDVALDDMYCARQMESISFGTEGSMEDFIYNHIREETSNTSEFSDLLQFSVYNSRYVEISESDDESTDEEKDNSSEQASGNDSFLSVQSRRVRIYPFSLSPIYEDDSACEDTLSNSSSPRFNEGAMSSNSGHDHTSILSLLQSVSDRLKESDLAETSHKERFLTLNNEVYIGNDKVNNEGSGEPEDTISPSKTSLDGPSTLEEEKASLGKRSGLFITKSLADKPNPIAGRHSFLLNLTSHSNIYGAKPNVESNPVPSVMSETFVSPIPRSNPDLSPDVSPSMAAMNLLSPEPVLPIQRSTLEDKPRMSSNSVFYQYFNSARNYVSDAEDKESPHEKLEESKKTAELDMDLADLDPLKFNPRPGKVILTDIIDLENKIELKADILDATSWSFPNGVNIRVIRGCWILYENPHFEGQAHVLEEGEAVLRHLWDLPGADAKLEKITIGSVKRVVKDYLPEVVISSLQDVSDSPIYIRTEVPSLENLVGKHPRSIAVNSGVWLAYTELQYSGTVTVLEEGCELPLIQDSGLKSMRPLKMGGLKVQLPSDPKIILYEKPHFQGWSGEITEHVSSLRTLACDGDNSGGRDIGSIQVTGGIWVGYENERYKGHQYLLEEGDYEDWHAWGGYNNIFQSIRYLQADFLESSVTLYETEDEDGKQLNLFNQAIPDLELVGYSQRMQGIHVKKGVWVAYQQKHFCGEQYILEKGRYKTYLDWGGSNNTILSIRPVLLEPLGRNDMKHLIKAYTSAEFQGETMDFTQGVSDFTSFLPMSFKVLRGCWLLCYKADTCDNLCVLEEGLFPDLASCGCPTAEIKYIKPIDYVFAEPSISLFALDSCEGRQLHFEEAVTSILNKDLHFYVQSVWVRGGLWIAFEGANFLGRQMLLDPQQILNWSQFSGWKAIGSLRPLKQPSVYFMVRNRDNDKYLTVSGKLADSRATFVTISPRNGQNTQIWYFCRGFLKSKANDLCLDVIGGKNIPGSKVSLWAEHGKTRQKWKVNKDGTISSHISDDLVLDLRGGNYYDHNYTVVNKFQENVLTQKWDIEIL
ncbi:very large A-kinase anchor protein [Hyla sarda]|uniref:very large A-kinase anchor protein n=1 Tax=Hyla sarda TaxID=327740 RepID=UPI0024C4423A|nr:very large A-kinase anchor protein [Hyla sarda]